MKKLAITLNVNGDDYTIAVYPTTTLVDALRDYIGLTGTKKGCGAGECGACTVLLDDEPIASCMCLAAQAEGHKIVTIEGMQTNGRLDVIQESFVENGAIQCGYCSPGFIMITEALIRKNPNPTLDEAKKAIAGNVCRCTGYQKIIDAIMDVPRRMQERGL